MPVRQIFSMNNIDQSTGEMLQDFNHPDISEEKAQPSHLSVRLEPLKCV